jgi:hypothetical protein
MALAASSVLRRPIGGCLPWLIVALCPFLATAALAFTPATWQGPSGVLWAFVVVLAELGPGLWIIWRLSRHRQEVVGGTLAYLTYVFFTQGVFGYLLGCRYLGECM